MDAGHVIAMMHRSKRALIALAKKKRQYMSESVHSDRDPSLSWQSRVSKVWGGIREGVREGGREEGEEGEEGEDALEDAHAMLRIASIQVFLCVAVCCSLLRCVSMCCSMLRIASIQVFLCVAVCCSLLQSVAVCCSV